MIIESKKLPAGLYFVATPIGNARDITLRALDVLASADVLAAEDTRTLRRLMDIHGVQLGDRPLVAYHDHNGRAARPKLLKFMAAGASVAYASEAGTPLVADPGYVLGREARDEGHMVTSAPGPSAMIAALTISSFPSDRFLFLGFPPSAKGARQSFFAEYKDVEATLGFYESPKRLNRTLGELAEVLGPNREAAICREITKKFEEVRRGTLADLYDETMDETLRGEIVLLLDRPVKVEVGPEEIDARLRALMADNSLKDAAALAAAELGEKKRDMYQRALVLSKEDEG